MVIDHYRKVEQWLAGLPGAPRIGCGAAYADAIPWKARHLARVGSWKPEARVRSGGIASALQPWVVLVLGNAACAVLEVPHPDGPAWSAIAKRIGDWEGHVLCLPHPNARLRGAGAWAVRCGQVHAALAAIR